MQKRILGIITLVSLLFSSLLPAVQVFASANDFYFKDMTVDYYVTRDEDGVSHARVVEQLTAVFPNYDQNHGIERRIPLTNQNGQNFVVDDINNFQVKVMRNGKTEPFTHQDHDDYVSLRIGDPMTFVRGEQTYTITYNIERFITEFASVNWADGPVQEFYWDVNGTDWGQRFENVTANIHFENGIKAIGTWCYQGSEYANEACSNSSAIADGYTFSAKNLRAGENLSFDIGLSDGTFTVPEANNKILIDVEDQKLNYDVEKDKDDGAIVNVTETITATFPENRSYRAFERNLPYYNDASTRPLAETEEELGLEAEIDGKKAGISATFYKQTYNDAYDRILPPDYGKSILLQVVPADTDYFEPGTHEITLKYTLKNAVSVPFDKKLKAYSRFSVGRLFDFSIFNEDYGGTQTLAISRAAPLYSDDLNPAKGFDSEITLKFGDGLRSKITGDPTCRDLRSIEDNDVYVSSVTTANINSNVVKNTSCSVSKISTGYRLSSADIKNNGLLLNFSENTFRIPTVKRSYIIIFICAFIIGIILLFNLIRVGIAKLRGGKKYRAYKNTPLVPEYTPYEGLSAAAMAEAYVKETKSPAVATMLELAVNKNIEIIRGPEDYNIFGISSGYKWRVRFLSLDGTTADQYDFLHLVFNQGDIEPGDECELEDHEYSYDRSQWNDLRDKHIKDSLRNGGFLEEKSKDKKSVLGRIASAFAQIISSVLLPFILVFLAPSLALMPLAFTPELQNYFSADIIMLGYNWIIPTIIISIAIIVFAKRRAKAIKNFSRFTEEGARLSRYMDGLKYYISMAEADRLKFLQSVEGVDTTPAGVVKLNEKLLPYASLFGLEKSWVNELNRYYQTSSITPPDYTNVIASSIAIAGFERSLAYSTSGTTYVSHSSGGGGGSSFGGYSGGSSSSSSGGGGGGFSGGGGGGGGGGGW